MSRCLFQPSLLAPAVVWFFCASASLGAPTDAGSILRQIERSLPPPQLPLVGPSPVDAAVVTPSGLGEKITVKSFGFDGNTVIPSAELAEALRSYLGRPLSFEEIKNAAAQVTLLYRERGYLAAAGIPKQDVTSGIVVIEVREGWFGLVRIDGAGRSLVQPQVLRSYINSACPAGKPLNLYDLDRSLLLLGDLSGAAVEGGISKGEAQGQADVVLVISPVRATAGNLLFDNSGARSTGSARALGGFTWRSPLGWGEQHGVDFLKSQGSQYFRVTSQLPIGQEGFKAAVRLSRMDYRLVAEEFAAARVNGDSTTLSLDGSVPLLRTRSLNVYASLGVDFKSFHNFGNAAVTSDYRSRQVNLSLKANRYDQWLGGGSSTFNLDVIRGTLDLDGSPSQAADASGPRAAGGFTKASLQCSRTQALFGSTSLVVSAEGQWALDRNLDSSEKFFVGGAGSVRAYPSSEGGGDSGYLATVELRHQFADAFTASAFIDHGRVFVNANPGFPGAAALNDLAYSGFGLGLAWNGPGDSRLSVNWSQRIGSNPNPKSSSLADQDGTRVLNRFWVSASISF